jgi:hypothetical protein
LEAEWLLAALLRNDRCSSAMRHRQMTNSCD